MLPLFSQWVRPVTLTKLHHTTDTLIAVLISMIVAICYTYKQHQKQQKKKTRVKKKET